MVKFITFFCSGTSFTLEFSGPLNETGLFNGNLDRWARVVLIGGRVSVVESDPPVEEDPVDQVVDAGGVGSNPNHGPSSPGNPPSHNVAPTQGKSQKVNSLGFEASAVLFSLPKESSASLCI